VKRGGRAARERDMLRAAVLTIDTPCLDCPGATVSVEWSAERDRYVVAVGHARTCPVRSGTWSERACNDRLRALLIMAGVRIADYSDDVTAHR
jgi:hypothetical protein